RGRGSGRSSARGGSAPGWRGSGGGRPGGASGRAARPCSAAPRDNRRSPPPRRGATGSRRRSALPARASPRSAGSPRGGAPRRRAGRSSTRPSRSRSSRAPRAGAPTAPPGPAARRSRAADSARRRGATPARGGRPRGGRVLVERDHDRLVRGDGKDDARQPVARRRERRERRVLEREADQAGLALGQAGDGGGEAPGIAHRRGKHEVALDVARYG